MDGEERAEGKSNRAAKGDTPCTPGCTEKKLTAFGWSAGCLRLMPGGWIVAQFRVSARRSLSLRSHSAVILFPFCRLASSLCNCARECWTDVNTLFSIQKSDVRDAESRRRRADAVTYAITIFFIQGEGKVARKKILPTLQ